MMTRWIARLAIIAGFGVIVAGPIGNPAGPPVEVAHWEPSGGATNTYYIQSTGLDHSWPIATAVRWVDQYTSSRMAIVTRCPARANCITIKAGKVFGGPDDPIGLTNVSNVRSGSSRWVEAEILVDVADARRSGEFGHYTKRYLLGHEIGHVLGLGHDKRCRSVMYQYRRCDNGQVPPWTLTAPQKYALRSR